MGLGTSPPVGVTADRRRRSVEQDHSVGSEKELCLPDENRSPNGYSTPAWMGIALGGFTHPLSVGYLTVYFHTEDVPLGGHAGALAVGRGNLYVGTTEGKPRVTRIPLTKIARAENTATLPNSKTYSTAAASYASFHRGRLFVGDFENDRVYRYDTTFKGAVIKKTRVAYPTPTSGAGAGGDRQAIRVQPLLRPDPVQLPHRGRP